MTITFEPVPEWLQDELSELVERELSRLCIPTTMSGLHYLKAAVVTAIQDPDRVKFITKELYPDIAKRNYTTSSCVERAMRTAVKASWNRGGRETLDEMAGYHITERPTNSEFIALLADHIRRKF